MVWAIQALQATGGRAGRLEDRRPGPARRLRSHRRNRPRRRRSIAGAPHRPGARRERDACARLALDSSPCPWLHRVRGWPNRVPGPAGRVARGDGDPRRPSLPSSSATVRLSSCMRPHPD
jgi:hypothetical protein